MPVEVDSCFRGGGQLFPWRWTAVSVELGSCARGGRAAVSVEVAVVEMICVFRDARFVR